jgi:hypothetical protein
MDLDAAAAGAHVAGRIGDLVADRLGIVDRVPVAEPAVHRRLGRS